MKIFLIGPMGSGKSKIGKILSSELDKDLFDLDKEIEKDLNLSINEIFKLKGEAYFRGIETKYLKKSLELKDCIVSTGGGIVESEENLNLLKNEKYVIFLNSKVESQFENTKGSDKRPLLNLSNPKEILQKLYDKRIDKYKKIAKMEFFSDSMSNEELANKIVNIFNE